MGYSPWGRSVEHDLATSLTHMAPVSVVPQGQGEVCLLFIPGQELSVSYWWAGHLMTGGVSFQCSTPASREGGGQYFIWRRILDVYPRCPVCQHFLLF